MSISQSITVLPAPPSRADPANFDARADGFLGALPTMQEQMNTWASQANSTATTVNDDKVAAQSAKSSAESARDIASGQANTAAGHAATATTQAGTATTQAGIATTQAGIATTQAGIATTQAGIATTKAGEAAASAALAVDVVSGGLTSTTPAANKIPLADGAAKIALGWLDLTGYAPAAQGVTNGNSHDHNGGDGAQIAYANLSGLPTLGTAAAAATTDFAAASHAHGNITAAGAIGSTANLPIITTTSGALTVGAFGTGATNFCAGNDARLSDARTPTAHNQAETTVTFTDVSTGNASTTAHGFAPKATAPASGLRSVLAIDNGETVRSDKALFDATNPAALGSASPGSAMTAARRDHVHPLPSMQETLTTARTYYVRTDGSDSNTGLANTSGGAFLTIGHAMDVARSINLSIYDITIAVGAGTFAEGLLPLPYVTGGGIIRVQGTAGSTTISLAAGNCIESYGLCSWSFANLILTTSDGRAVEANDGSHIALIDVTFGAVNGQAIAARYGAWVTLEGDMTITGDCDAFFSAFRNGAIYCYADSITLSGTRAFTTFAVAELASYIQFEASFTGSATGKRYAAEGNGVIYTFGAGATYLPGDVAGTTATGGQYL